MKLEIANAPVSWGVERAEDERNPPWELFLNEVAKAGYDWVELGPVGFLPLDEVRNRVVSEHDPKIIAGYVYQPLSEPGLEDFLTREAESSSASVRALGGRYIVVMDKMNSERMASAGRSQAARRLDGPSFTTLIENIERVSDIANDHDLRPVFHPHVGSFVEFEDEIAKCVAELDHNKIGLCLDTGHAAYAGLDPVDVYCEYAERIEYFHFKDVDPAVRRRVEQEQLGWDDAVEAGIFCPLGEGLVDFGRLQDALQQKNFQGWGAVEQDTPPGRYGEARSAAAASLEYLKKTG